MDTLYPTLEARDQLKSFSITMGEDFPISYLHSMIAKYLTFEYEKNGEIALISIFQIRSFAKALQDTHYSEWDVLEKNIRATGLPYCS